MGCDAAPTMSDEDPIHDLLARIATHTMDLRPGYLAAPFGQVEANGGDVDAVREWVEARDGYIDDTEAPKRTGLRAGQTFERADPTDRRRFIIPASALGK